ncbi:hypothetical protein [Thalassotalea crassostreae]|uniref:hypothetical protein n=1 Tax=Thalassotalea crassostreae TaxID=1763536 RepID=UPI000837D083|nr:hypothetical protein [Thalassotalea crassostreae]
MNRHLYVADNIEDLQLISDELEKQGISKPQMHFIEDQDDNDHFDYFFPVKYQVFNALFNGDHVTLSLLVFSFILASVSFLLGYSQLLLFWFLIVAIFSAYTLYTKPKDFLVNANESALNREELKSFLQQGCSILLLEVNANQEVELKKIIAKHNDVVLDSKHYYS